ncbi:hypothetical protein D3C71_551710 [compost metagenome]
MKKLLIFVILITLFASQSQAQDTTNTQNSYFLEFVKKVYFNPTVLLRTQKFREDNKVRALVLPDLNGGQTNQITGFEKAMQKIIRFLIEGDDKGSIRFYFDSKNTSKPFSFVCSDELWCKFPGSAKDSIEKRLNAPFQGTNFNLNSHVLFETAITGGLNYASTCLQNSGAECSEEPDNKTTEINTKPLSISLHNTSGSKFDIDTKQFNQLESHYAKATDLFTQQDWYAPAKVIVSGTNSDEPMALAINKHESLFKKENLKIKMLYNSSILPVLAGSTNDSIRFNIPKDLPKGNPVEVVVTYKSTVDSITYTVGFFMIQVMEKQTVKLNLLAANGFNVTDQKTQIENELKKVYDPVGIAFEVTVKTWDPIIDSEWPTSIQIANSGLLSNYPPDLRDWVNGVQDLADYDKDEYYLVFGLSTSELAGYMPRARNIGFIFSKGTDMGEISAHELGHGVFHLRHIFAAEELGEEERYQTSNVMDYKAVEASKLKDLYLHQWKFIDDPAFVSWFGGDDEEGEAIYNQSVRLFISNKGSYTVTHQLSTNVDGFYTPSGYAVSFGDVEAKNWVLENIRIDEYSGGVSGFTLNNIDYSGLYQFSGDGSYVFHFYIKSDDFTDVQEEFKQYKIGKEEEAPTDGNVDSWFILNYINKHHSSIPNLRYSYPNENILIQFFGEGCNSFLCISKRVVLSNSAKDPASAWQDNKFKPPLKGERSPFYLRYINTTGIGPVAFISQNSIALESEKSMNEFMCEYVAILAKKKYGARFLEKFNFNDNFKEELGIGFNSNGVVDTLKARSFIKIAKAYDDLDDNIIAKIGNRDLQNRLKAILDYKFSKTGKDLTSLEQAELYFQLLLKVQTEIKTHLSKIKNSKDEDYITYVVMNLLDDEDLKLLKLSDRINMVKCLVTDWMWHDEEIAALRILKTAQPEQSTEILKELLTDRDIYSATTGLLKYKNIFTALYHRVTGKENTDYITVLFKLWYDSDYARTDRPEYVYKNKPMVFDYKSEKILGFYDSNWNVDKTDDFSHVSFTREIPSYVMNYPLASIPPVNIYYAGADLFNTIVKQTESYSYHPFQPIGLVSIDQSGEDIQFPSERIPAFLLYAFDDVNTSQNIRFASEIALDIITTVVGVPPFLSALKHGLTAFKQLSRARKIVLGVKTLEFTAGAANLILKYTCSEQNQACQGVQSFLTCLEVACLSGDAIYGVIVKRKAKKLLASNLDDVRQMDNADEIEELLRKTADDFAGLGLDFQKYLKKAIAASPELSTKIASISFKGGDEFLDIIVHADAAGNFFIKAEGSAQKALSKQELANIMNAAPSGKKIRLLSCNDETAAKELSTLVNRPFYASDGWVDVYEGGQVYSKNKFHKYSNGSKSSGDYLPHNSSAPEGLGNKVRMGRINWNSVQTVTNKYPDEALPSDGVLWGIAEIENGLIKSLPNRGNTFDNLDFVVAPSGELRLGKKHHFLGNRNSVEAAGTIRISNGKLKKITNFSGHYVPSIEEANKFPEIFRQLGIDTKGASLVIQYLDEAGNLKSKTIILSQ